MPTIRYPTDGPQYLTLRARGWLGEICFQVVEPTGALREPVGLRTLEDLDRWMLEHGYTIASQRPDYRGRRGRQHYVIADVIPQPVAASAARHLTGELQSLDRAKAVARERAERNDCPYYVIRVQPGDCGPSGGYAVADIEEIEDFWHAGDNDILFATA
jgi:hypothetical protein